MRTVDYGARAVAFGPGQTIMTRPIRAFHDHRMLGRPCLRTANVISSAGAASQWLRPAVCGPSPDRDVRAGEEPLVLYGAAGHTSIL